MLYKNFQRIEKRNYSPTQAMRLENLDTGTSKVSMRKRDFKSILLMSRRCKNPKQNFSKLNPPVSTKDDPP